MSRNFFFGWLAFLTVLCGLAAFSWHWLDSGLDLCEDAVMQKAVSPDARLTAIVYSRSCGVLTTGFTTQVALVRNGESQPKDAGNVYIETSEASQPQVSVQWQGSQSLLVKDDARAISSHIDWAEKRVKVNLGWFRSTDVAVNYADLPVRQKAKLMK